MALVPWGGSSATQYSAPSSPFEPNGIIYANDVNAAIRLPSLVASAIWNTLGVVDVDYNKSLTDAESALNATVLACEMEYNSSIGAWVFPNKIIFGDGVGFDSNAEFNSGISVNGATTLNSSLTVNGGAILTRSIPTQEALRINVGKSIFEYQTIDNVRYSSSYTASHAFFLEAYYGGSPIPTYATSISAASIVTPQISSSSLTVPFNSIYSSYGSESLEARLNRLGFKEGEPGTDFTVPSGSPATNISLRKLGKLVIFTANVTITNFPASTATSNPIILIKDIVEEFRPYRYPYGSTFYSETSASGATIVRFDVGFDNDTGNDRLGVHYKNNESFACNFGASVILSWFTEDPSNFSNS